MGANVLVSYAMADRSFAQQVAQDLRSSGIDTVTDVDILQPGQNWADGLRAALDRSDVVVTVMSRVASNSSFVMTELGAAVALKKRVVLVKLDGEPLPFSLSDVEVVDGSGMSAGTVADAVLTQLKTTAQARHEGGSR